MSQAVSALLIYPVKSCGGVRLSRAQVEPYGLAQDRRWMLIDDAGEFLSLRRCSRMALVRVAPSGPRFVLEAPGCPDFELPESVAAGEEQRVSVFGNSMLARVHEATSRWFSRALGLPCRAVYLPDPRLSFADAFPCLLISEASLDELRRRCPEPMHMERFRPNIVLSGGDPHFEDRLTQFQLGEVRFRAPKLCDRCRATLVDPETGALGREPLRTLASYRRWDQKVWFGVNLVPESSGLLAVGDELKEPPTPTAHH